MIIMWSEGLKFRSQSRFCQGFQVLSLHKAHLACAASERTIHSLTVPRTLTRRQRFALTDFGAINSEAITLAFCTIKTRFFRIGDWIVMLWLGSHVWNKPLIALGMLAVGFRGPTTFERF